MQNSVGRWINDYAALVECSDRVKSKYSRKKDGPMPHCSPQIPQGLTWCHWKGNLRQAVWTKKVQTRCSMVSDNFRLKILTGHSALSQIHSAAILTHTRCLTTERPYYVTPAPLCIFEKHHLPGVSPAVVLQVYWKMKNFIVLASFAKLSKSDN